ncbi:hypothetical protein BDV98DRAFT_575422 [Pterulicium gracile]|uniref:Uncharacterized protein n=1 Tax=Pterulicium gracile TaxID=1884261 RepID=A0A5C3Q9S7_9AGAR|nr:hypothetical protein BDV98DRAFT_575422 [Pterula gracilis]
MLICVFFFQCPPCSNVLRVRTFPHVEFCLLCSSLLSLYSVALILQSSSPFQSEDFAIAFSIHLSIRPGREPQAHHQ